MLAERSSRVLPSFGLWTKAIPASVAAKQAARMVAHHSVGQDKELCSNFSQEATSGKEDGSRFKQFSKKRLKSPSNKRWPRVRVSHESELIRANSNLVISLETENRIVDDNCDKNCANTSANVDSYFSSLIAEFCSGDLFCSKSRTELRPISRLDVFRRQGDHHVRNTSKASFSSRNSRPSRRVTADNVAAYQLPSNNIHQDQSSCPHINRRNERVHSIEHSHET